MTGIDTAAAPTESAPQGESVMLRIEADCCERVNYAMQQNGVPVVARVSLTNPSEQPVEDLVVRLTLSNREATPWEKRVARIGPDETYHVAAEDFGLDPRLLATRTESERTRIEAEVEWADGRATWSGDLELLPFNEWSGLGACGEIVAAFATPNHPSIAELLGDARRAMAELDQCDALDGYQSGSRRRSSLLAEACFSAVAARDIGYINPPASFEQSGQRVRLVDQILREKLATCLDLSLLLASMWEQVGLHPLLVLMDGHALPAVWLHDTHFEEPMIEDVPRLRNRIQLGEIIAVESTILTQAQGSFAAAIQSAHRRLEAAQGLVQIVDIRSARKLGVRPLPLRVEADSAIIDPALENEPTEVKASQTRLDAVDLAERAALQQAEAGAAREERPQDRVDKWKRHLLDLSLRNRLINFRVTARAMELDVPRIDALEDALAAGESFQISGKPAKDNTDPGYLASEQSSRRLHSIETKAETEKRLLNIYRLSRSAIQETGANILHLALGTLVWYETDAAETARTAPLILLPVTLDRSSTGGGYKYTLRLSEEPLRPNVTLLEKLRHDFGIECKELEEMPEDESGIAVPLILRRFRDAIKDIARWEVRDSAVLGLFSFNKFLMWRDVEEYTDRLKENRLVKHLIDRTGDTFRGDTLPFGERMDEESQPGELLCTRDADSSQLAAVKAAVDGKTYVLEGPPGTGKTQTITNIIANALGQNQRVLFVAEKLVALQQVHDRLVEDGLGSACLELHSAKASKKEVLRQLDEALNADAAHAPGDWPEVCSKLKSQRDRLNKYVRALHARHASGESVYQVLGRLERLGEGASIDPPLDAAADVDRSQLGKWRDQINRLSNAAAPVDPVASHPLRGIGRADWSFGLPDESASAISAARQAIRDLRVILTAAAKGLGVENAEQVVGTLQLAELRAMCEALALLHRSVRCEPDLMTTSDWNEARGSLRKELDRGRQRDARKAALLRSYREEVLEADLLVWIDEAKRASQKPALVRWFFARKVISRVRPLCLESPPALEALTEHLEEAHGIAGESKGLSEDRNPGARMFGSRWQGGHGDWDELEKTLQWVTKLNGALAKLTSSEAGRTLESAVRRAAPDSALRSSQRPAFKAAVEAWNGWTQSSTALARVLKPEAGWDRAPSGVSGWLAAAEGAFERWADSLGELNNWCTWRREREAACASGLVELVTRYECGELTRDQLSDAFERGFGKAWLRQTADRSEALRGFNAAAHDSAVREFRELDRRLISLTQQIASARVAAQRTIDDEESEDGLADELWLLSREIEKRARHIPTRQLVQRLPNLLPRLKPCFLMSPLSVAQYLDPHLPPFDLVVFDEASQIPVWDSIGALARGREVVVVGDSKQLPPTNFFGAVDSDDDSNGDGDGAVPDDMESILKECNASGVPSMRLTWHYRSRHESLIAFSNYHYYDNNLHVFPSPSDRSDSLGISLRVVESGVYDRGRSSTNKIEAETVVDDVVQMLKADDANGSIGIVTFSMQQQRLIEDLLDAARREHPEIEEFFRDGSDGVFVKNLENVQGDERDTIIFSIGYGKDETGRMTMNFGPLNKDGGERRLNVAITRAKRRLLIYSSITGDMIDLRRTRALGVRHLKTFLEFAQHGPRAMAEVSEAGRSREFDSGFERAVCEALEERGWEVDTQIGCAGYRVDLGIRHPDRPGRYILGVECDGAAYHSARVARDRDRLRQSILEGLGWRIVRVWSTEWRINRQRCLEAIEQAMSDALLD